MSSLNDVALSTISTNQVLQWNGTKWSNATMSLVTALSGLTDTSISNTVDGNSLYYYSYLNKWYNGPNKMMNYDTSAYITQSNYTGNGTSLSPSQYSYNTWFYSLVCDCSFISQVSSYFIKLPTALSNGSVIYIQIASSGSQQLGILGGNTPQDNLYTSLNNWVGYVYASTPTTYKLTFYSPSSNNPWHGNTNFKANSWQVENVPDIPLN